MAMVSLLGQNDEMVRFQSLGKKAGSAFPVPVATPGMLSREIPGKRRYRSHNKRDMISVLSYQVKAKAWKYPTDTPRKSK
jgi:hypothetical protein